MPRGDYLGIAPLSAGVRGPFVPSPTAETPDGVDAADAATAAGGGDQVVPRVQLPGLLRSSEGKIGCVPVLGSL